MGGPEGGGCPHCAQPARPGPGGCRGPLTSLGAGVGSRPGSTGTCSSGCLAVAVGWGRGGGLGDLGPREGSASPTFTEKPPCVGAVLGKRGALVTRQSPHPLRAHCLGDSVREVDTDFVAADLGWRLSGCSGGLRGAWPGSCSHSWWPDRGPGEGSRSGGPVGSVCSSPGDLEEAGETSGWAEEGEASGPALRTGAGRMEADAALPRPCP